MAASTSLTPAQRSLRSRMGAQALHAQGKTNTAPGRAKFLSRFEQQVDPEGTLDPRTRAQRAEHARKAYFTSLALKSSQARSQRAKSSSTVPSKAPSTAAAHGSRDCAGTSRPPVHSADPPGLVTPGAAGLDTQPGANSEVAK